jgi:hypothetical protein
VDSAGFEDALRAMVGTLKVFYCEIVDFSKAETTLRDREALPTANRQNSAKNPRCDLEIHFKSTLTHSGRNDLG